jgi:hypothetical protein
VNVPEVRDEIHAEDGEETIVVDRSTNAAEPNQDADSGDDHLVVLVSAEHWRVGVEVAGSLRVSLLARCVEKDISRPSTELHTTIL